MANRFATALKEHPAPRVLGDVTLRYEPSMLIGETPKPLRSWRPTAVWVAALSVGLTAVALLATGRLELTGGAVLVGLTGVLFLGAVWLERVERRRRAFIVNFLTTSLRLDFVTPFAGQPRTLIVPFDAVKAVDTFEQDAGTSCLTVDFEAVPGGPVLREVLAAWVPEAQASELERLTRVLRGAFGLGEPEEPAAEGEAPGELETQGPAGDGPRSDPREIS